MIGSIDSINGQQALTVWFDRIFQTDITKLDQLEQQFRMFLEAAADAMVIINAKGVIQFVNAQTERLFGYPRDQLLGQPVERLLPERFAAAHGEHRHHFFAAPQARPMGTGMMLCGLTKGGQEFPVEISLSPIETTAGVLVSAAVRDVTDRYVAEETLREAKAVAEQANAAKSRFLAAASHDLRQPLQTMNIVQGLLTRLVKEPRAETPLRHLAEAIKSMDGMLNALLDINRLETGVIIPKLTDFPMASLFAQMLSDFSYIAEQKGLQLRFVASRLQLHSDKELLQEMLRNLIANAIKYTEHGTVLVGCRRRGEQLRIEVWDTGPGISEDRRQKIFEEFYQVDNPERDRRRGLGLGLAIVERLARLLEHPLDVRSSVGRGSCFAIEVPRAEDDLSHQPATVESVVMSAADDTTILYIEDDPMIRDALRMLLEIEGFQVSLASNGWEALLQITEHNLRPDVILTDYRLPAGETGYEIAQKLQQSLGVKIPTIIITGDTSTEQRQYAEQAGYQLLHKPIDDNLLLSAIRQQLTG